MAFLFPPLGASDRRRATLDLARQRQRRAPHFTESPARMNPYINMHPPRTAGLGPSAETHLLKDRLHLERDGAHLAPAHARTGIEVDPQLIRMIQVARAHRMWMQLEASEVDDPRQSRRVVDDDFFRGASRWKRERDGAQPRGPIFRRALLIERLALGAIDVAFQYDGAIANSAQRAGRDREIVADQVELGEF